MVIIWDEILVESLAAEPLIIDQGWFHWPLARLLLQISFSSSEGTRITQNIWLDWAGSGATSCLHWTARIIQRQHPAPVLPSASLPPSNEASCVCHKVQEKVPVPWGWRRKQLQRNKLLILMFQEKEKRERTRRPERMTPSGWCCSFPQDGSSLENTE